MQTTQVVPVDVPAEVQRGFGFFTEGTSVTGAGVRSTSASSLISPPPRRRRRRGSAPLFRFLWEVKYLAPSFSSFGEPHPFDLSLAQGTHWLPLQPRPQARKVELVMAARQGDRLVGNLVEADHAALGRDILGRRR
jgi:hypothetical protein